MQLIHKFMRGRAQRIDIVNHTVQPLQQLADFRFITEGTDGADDSVLAAYRHGVADQQEAVAAEFAVVNRLAGLQNLLQIRQQRGVGNLFAGAAEQDLASGRVDQRDATLDIHRDNPFF